MKNKLATVEKHPTYISNNINKHIIHDWFHTKRQPGCCARSHEAQQEHTKTSHRASYCSGDNWAAVGESVQGKEG